MAEGRLAGGRRPCNQDQLLCPACRDFIGDLRDSLFLKRLLCKNQLPCPALRHQIVQIPNRVDVHELAPFPGLILNIEQLSDRLKWRHLLRFLRGRHHQDESVPVQLQVKMLQVG